MANMWTSTQAGLGTYTTGGITIATTLSMVAAMDVVIQTIGNLGRVIFVITPDSPSAGQATVKIMRENYNLYSAGGPTGLPSGVTAQTSSGQNLTAEASHTMDITHGHNTSAASTTMAGASGLVTQAVTGGVNTTTHTHTVNITSAAFTSGVGSSHTHTWNNLYQHNHNVTNTATDVSLVELANGIDLSGTTVNIMAVDE